MWRHSFRTDFVTFVNKPEARAPGLLTCIIYPALALRAREDFISTSVPNVPVRSV